MVIVNGNISLGLDLQTRMVKLRIYGQSIKPLLTLNLAIVKFTQVSAYSYSNLSR